MQFSLKLSSLISVCALAGVAHAFDGDATWFFPGLGSCGVTNSATDFIVALNSAQAAANSNCGRTINVQYQGRSVNVVVTDTCPGCGANGIDLSPGAFQALGASLDAGRIPVSWNFV